MKILGAILILPAAILLAVLAFVLLPSRARIRFCLRLAVRLLYRLRVRGIENLPHDTGALLVANHLSWADAPLVMSIPDRQIRFLIEREIYDHPLFRRFFRCLCTIPLSAKDPPHAMEASLKQAARELEEGQLVMVFPEGECTKDGRMRTFRRGFGHIMKNLPPDSRVPIIPVRLDGLWGSIFSYERGRLFWKVPRKIPYPATISFGPPMPPRATPAEVQKAVEDLMRSK